MEITGVRHGRVKHSLHILLHGLIDYAGLFPPAGLKMADAVSNYARYKAGPNAWALGRFIVPAARLSEFESCFTPDKTVWHLSALLGQSPVEDLARISEFNTKYDHAALIDTLETKVTTPEAIAALRRESPESILLYFEVANLEEPEPFLREIRAAHARAKIRTGGLTPEMFPSAPQIIRFLELCVENNVAFKATAGLHHPVRCLKPLTYEKDAPTGTMHGFLNVFLAAAFLLEGLPAKELEDLLGEEDPASFGFEDGGASWRNHKLSQTRLLESRALAASFGSCSFEEPIEDLMFLNLL